MFKLTPDEQLKELKKGTVDFVSEEELLKKLKNSYENKKPLRVKAGFDPSRPDLHLGHAVLINKMKQFQDLGHHAIFLIGDFTAMIGDPTGKNETRPPLTPEEITENAKTYAQQVFKILDPGKTEVVYNNSWFGEFSGASFIRLASQYTVARMLERDDFEKRFKNNDSICLHEFLYPLVQGYDSVALKADVELGGTDQLFNLLIGRDIQKSYGVAPQCVMTVPILEGLDGIQKMSKSLDNYIAIEDSPKEMFGKTMKISDELMITYYELLTDKSIKEIEQLRKSIESGQTHPRQAKVDLAKFFVTRFHNAKAAVEAEEEFNRIFKEKGLPDKIPEFLFNAQEEPLWICHLMVKTDLAKSSSEARRLIQGAAVELAGEKIQDPQYKVELVKGQEFIIKAGKKKFAKVVVNS
ncbi:MAG: tyrosine--tRNA ligase [Bdellovibrionales bacterium]|nr:tyrosine--tRNA ligase [Bdellovibrionales bacterium]